GFAEFNLQPWYDLNLNTSKINSIEFIATYQGDLFEGVIAVHDMLTREDGTFGANLADFNASLSLIQGNITKSSYNPELIVDVKSAILADIDASQQWTGI
ncbi:hypothetical protein RZS08_04175, partial [Arthrospira platensis SPKY1]|nr:hypothetical protein [Arthrospira platensis SPKY1]